MQFGSCKRTIFFSFLILLSQRLRNAFSFVEILPLRTIFFFGIARKCQNVSESQVSEVDFLNRCRKSMSAVGVSECRCRKSKKKCQLPDADDDTATRKGPPPLVCCSYYFVVYLLY